MAERPNILLVVTHDLGKELNCLGNRSISSPRLDALAGGGMTFTNYFCASTPCCPSRGCIMTGRYAHTNGLMGLTIWGWDMPDQPHLANYMGDLGYNTYLFGFQDERRDVRRNGYQHVALRKWPRINAVADDVIEFLHSDAAHAQPFLLSVGCYEVHRRFELPEYTRGDPASVTVHPFLRDTPEVREDLAWFHGSIAFMDQHVGRILDALRASGLEQNTIVVFTTDHGAALLRAKGTLYDPGIETALIVRWPGHVAENRTCNELLSNVDLLPTLIELAGGTPGPMIQGRSFASLLTGGSWTPRPAVFCESNYRDEYDPMRAIRTGRYKYIRSFAPQFGHPVSKDIRRSHSILSLRVEDCAARPGVELYDLETDPHEVHNLADDPAYLEVRNDLAGQLHQWMVDTSDPLLAGPIAAPPGATVEPPFASAEERFEAIMQEYRQYGGT